MHCAINWLFVIAVFSIAGGCTTKATIVDCHSIKLSVELKDLCSIDGDDQGLNYIPEQLSANQGVALTIHTTSIPASTPSMLSDKGIVVNYLSEKNNVFGVTVFNKNHLLLLASQSFIIRIETQQTRRNRNSGTHNE